jgi:hypothetical protein
VSVRLEVCTEIDASVAVVWEILIDWTGQSRWIPLTTVQITTNHNAGLGVRAEALSGILLACWTASSSPAGRRRLMKQQSWRFCTSVPTSLAKVSFD